MKKNMPSKFFLTALIGLGIINSTAIAQSLATYEFSYGGANNPTGLVTSTAPNVTASNTTWNGLTGTIGFGGSFDSAFVSTNALSTSLTTSQYLEFQVTADVGTLDLGSFSFDLGGSRTTGSTDYTVNAAVRTDVDSYGSNVTLFPGSITTASSTFNSTTPSYDTFTADLSSNDYDGLTDITFRLYVWRTSGSSSTIFLRADSLNVSSTVVPEPAAAGLLLGGLILFACVSRRPSRKNRG